MGSLACLHAPVSQSRSTLHGIPAKGTGVDVGTGAGVSLAPRARRSASLSIWVESCVAPAGVGVGWAALATGRGAGRALVSCPDAARQIPSVATVATARTREFVAASHGNPRMIGVASPEYRRRFGAGPSCSTECFSEALFSPRAHLAGGYARATGPSRRGARVPAPTFCSRCRSSGLRRALRGTEKRGYPHSKCPSWQRRPRGIAGPPSHSGSHPAPLPLALPESAGKMPAPQKTKLRQTTSPAAPRPPPATASAGPRSPPPAAPQALRR